MNTSYLSTADPFHPETLSFLKTLGSETVDLVIPHNVSGEQHAPPSIEDADRMIEQAQAHKITFASARITLLPSRYAEAPGPERSLLSGWIDYAMYIGCRLIRFHITEEPIPDGFGKDALLPLLEYMVDYELHAAVFPESALEGLTCPTGEESISGIDAFVSLDGSLAATSAHPVVSRHCVLPTALDDSTQSAIKNLLNETPAVPLILHQ